MVWACAASVVGWAVPVVGLVLLPLQYLNTHAHEFFHAVAALGTGGGVQHIMVNADGSGVTNIGGGSVLVVASAGYLGTAILGGILLAAGRTDHGARNCLWALAGLLALSMVVWVRGDLVGVLSGLVWIAILGVAAKNLKGDALHFALAFLGVQIGLQSLQSLLVLLNISTFTNVQSDAAILQNVTGIPALFWALLWTGLGGLAVWGGLRTAWSQSRSA